mgnify:FL=1
MKKILTGIFALTLVASMSFQTFAVTNDGTAGTEIEVNGTFTAAADPSIVVSADVTWNELSFTYQDGYKHWDAEKHMDVADEGAWETTKKNITVTNHSNTSIKASFEFPANVEGLNGSFDKTEFDLASAENTTTENAPTGTTSFGISGGAITKDQKIGTITVKITSDTLDTTMVKNLEDLRSVFENGGKAKLNSDLNGAYEMLMLSSGKDLEFDLNRKTLSVESISLSNDGNETLTLRNGTIGCYVQMNGSAEQHLIVDNCTLNELCDNNNYSDVTLKNCVITKDCFTSYGGIWKFEGVNNITGTMKVKKDVTISGDFTLGTLKVPMVTTGTPTLKLSGNIRIGKFSFDSVYREEAKIICGVGTYNFKPDEYETGRYGGIQLAEGCTVSGPDENGIYTVTAE